MPASDAKTYHYLSGNIIIHHTSVEVNTVIPHSRNEILTVGYFSNGFSILFMEFAKLVPLNDLITTYMESMTGDPLFYFKFSKGI